MFEGLVKIENLRIICELLIKLVAVLVNKFGINLEKKIM
jgi:hypothetical protein